jgi:hypothetical protein
MGGGGEARLTINRSNPSSHKTRIFRSTSTASRIRTWGHFAAANRGAAFIEFPLRLPSPRIKCADFVSRNGKITMLENKKNIKTTTLSIIEK